MHISSKVRHVLLAIVLTTFSFSQAEAQFWGKLKNAAKNKAEEIAAEKIAGKDKEKTKTQEKKTPSKQDKKKSQSVSVKTNTQKQAAKTQKLSPTMVTYQTGTPNGDLDIVGLRLGMSPSQAEAALKVHNSDYRITYKRAKLYGDRSLPKNGKKATNIIPNSDYVAQINASDEGFRSKQKGTHILLSFARPPSKNKLLYIERTTIFQDAGPTIEAYNKAFVKKYGDKFYSLIAAAKLKHEEQKKDPIFKHVTETQGEKVYNHDTKVIGLKNGQKFTNEESYKCYGNIRYARKVIKSNLFKKNHEECGLILASQQSGRSDIPAVSRFVMSLIDFNEINKTNPKTVKLIQDHNKKMKQEKLDAAAKKDVDIF